jgi:ribonuclease I
LQGLIPGVYTLDVIVDISSSSMAGAYETVLIMLQPDQQPVDKSELTKIIQRTEIGTEFDDYLYTGWPNAYCEGEGDARICWESKEIKEQADRLIHGIYIGTEF